MARKRNVSLFRGIYRLRHVYLHNESRYDKETGTGGSNGSTMRFAPESEHGANAGLHIARDFLEPIKRARIRTF